VAEQAKLVDGERALRLEREKGLEAVAEAEFAGGRLSLDELQATRRQGIEARLAEGLLGADTEANKRRADLDFQRSEIEGQIAQRQAYLKDEEGRVDDREKRTIGREIAERQSQLRVIQQQLGDIESERDQKRRGVTQQGDFDLARDEQRRLAEAKTLQERRETGALGIIGQAGALLKSQGIEQATSEQLGQTFDQLGQKHQQTLDLFKAGGAVSPDDLSAAIRFQSERRSLQDLGVSPGGAGGFLSTTAGADADKAYWDQWFGERLKSGVSVPSFGAAPSLNFPGTPEAAIREQLGLGPVPNINADLVVQGFDGAWQRVKAGAVSMVTELDRVFAGRAEGWAASIEDRVLARLRDTLYRDFQRQ
jgi:hypothetical protein